MQYLKVTNLTKSYTDKLLVDHIDFTITSYDELSEFVSFGNETGEVYQYDGKTSNILTDLMQNICESVAEGL